MKAARHLFADLTVLLEDLHAIVVEGQSTDASPGDYTVRANRKRSQCNMPKSGNDGGNAKWPVIHLCRSR